MKKRGFTLIELLAVIVVLAIIALIATPIVMNTIKKSQKGAAERSTENYIDAVETAVATKRLDNVILEGTYTINDKGNLEGNGLTKPLEIEMSGNKPTGGTITIKNGQVTTDSKMTVGSYEVSYNPTTKKFEAAEGTLSKVVYRWSKDIITIGDTINDSTKYTTDSSTLGKSGYLKHVLDKDNKVTESYVCAIFNSKEYCLKGGNSSFYSDCVLVLNKISSESIEGISCYSDDKYASCGNDDITLAANDNGAMNSGGSFGLCNVNDIGESSCEE